MEVSRQFPDQSRDVRVDFALKALSDPGSKTTISEISVLVGLSPSRLRYLIKHHTGLSSLRHRKLARLIAAKQILESSTCSVKEARTAAGITDPSHFTRGYGYDLQRTITADNKQTSRHALGLGDIEVELTRQLTRERGSRPDLLVSVRWKTTTGPDPFQLGSTEPALGTGFNSFTGSLTASKSSDPVVFIGGLSYTANLGADKKFLTSDPSVPNSTETGYFHPGDTIGLQMALALAVNPATSLSFG